MRPAPAAPRKCLQRNDLHTWHANCCACSKPHTSGAKTIFTKYEKSLARVKALNDIVKRHSQSLAQMAIAWVLRNPRMTSALIGASRPEQVEDCVGALDNLRFSSEELAEIDQYAVDSNVNLWSKSSSY